MKIRQFLNKIKWFLINFFCFWKDEYDTDEQWDGPWG